MEVETTNPSERSGVLSPRQIFWILYLVTIVAVIIKGPAFTIPLWDISNDDAMRLVQVRDLLSGQSWFNLTQHRLGLDSGTLMHWSRLIDLPIAAILFGFSIFLTSEWAELSTMVLWPFVLIGPTLWAMHRASVRFGGKQAGPFGYIFAIIAIYTTHKFDIGSLDHHNVQMMLMAFILMSVMHREHRAKDGVIIGLTSALSIAIGLEMLIFIVTICAMIGVTWIVVGKDAARKTIWFTVTFSLTLVVIYVVTNPSFESTVFRCDAFGLELLTIGLSGGIGLSVLAIAFSTKSRLFRTISVLLLGCAVILISAIFAPHCLGNPYDPLYPEVAKEWLGRISESKSLFGIIANGKLNNFGFVVIPVIAIVFTLYISRKPSYRLRAITLFLILAGAYAMMFYQIRGLFFLLQLCAIPLAAMVGQAYANYKNSNTSVKGFLFIIVLFISIPATWVAGASLVTNKNAKTENVIRLGSFTDCYRFDEYIELLTLPTGTVATSTDLGVAILLNTPHNTISANFHRNQDGILANIELMKTDIVDAEFLLRKTNVDYVVLCVNDFATQAFADIYPDGLWYSLYRGNVPAYLTPVPGREEKLIYVYKTQP